MYEFYFRYTYGKPVKGIADVRIRLEYPRFDWINNTRVKVSSEVELQFPVNAYTDEALYLNNFFQEIQ